VEARTHWTDRRLDDQAAQTAAGFRRVDDRSEAQFKELTGHIIALQRTMLLMFATIVVGFVSLLLTYAA
jgi:hypothetical protein